MTLSQTPAPTRRQGLSLRVLLFIVLPLAALTALVPLASLTLHAQAMRSLVADRDQRAAAGAAAAMSAELEFLGNDMRGMALTAAAVPHTSAEFLSNYSFLLTDLEGGLALYTSAGQLVAASGAPTVWQGRPVVDLLARTSNPETAVFSPTFLDPSTGQYAVLVAAAGPTDGSGTGLRAVGAFYPASLARRALTGLVTASNAVGAWVIDPQGQLLYLGGQPQQETDLRQHAGVAEALRGESGSLYVQVAATEHVVAFDPVPPAGWALVIEEPWEAVDNPLLRTTLAAPLILIPVVLVAVIAIAFGLRQIVQPLRALAHNAAELGWGRFDAIKQPVGGIGEIRTLQAELIQMAHKVKIAQQNLRDYTSAITLGQEDERRRLASGLHDGTVQSLIALDQRVQMAQMKLKDGPPEAAARLAEVRQMTAGLIDDVRRVIRALRPIYLEDLGLLPALEMLTRDVDLGGLPATFSTTGTVVRLPPEREIVVYRVAQEALSNVVRHAAATAVQVKTEFDQHEFVLRVEDNGKGFIPPERIGDLAAAGHYGLIGMQERGQLIGGQLSLQSAPNHGTTLELRLPL